MILKDIGRAVFRHKRKTLATFLLVTGTATLIVFLLPKTYRSEGKFFVRLGRENAMIDTAATLGTEPAIAVPQSRENEINSLVEVLGSRAIVEKVADALGPDALFGSTAATAVAHERAILQLRARIAVTPVRKSNVIGIACEGPSPEWAQMVVAKLMDVYQVEHIRLNRPYGSLEFFTEQAARLDRELARKEKSSAISSRPPASFPSPTSKKPWRNESAGCRMNWAGRRQGGRCARRKRGNCATN